LKLKHKIVDFWDRLILVRERIVKWFEWAIFLVLLLAFALIIYQIGFPKEIEIQTKVDGFLREVPLITMILYFVKWLLTNFIRISPKIFDRNQLPDLVFSGLLLLYIRMRLHVPILEQYWFLYLLLSVFFIVRVMREGSLFNRKGMTPSGLFVTSFVMLILVGTAMLLVPNVTSKNISFIDALFTATSAVCVTGLAVVDTSTAFTAIGKDLLLVLIQIGGLGLMTFTNFFAVLFKGGMSFRNHLILSDLIQSDKPNSLFSTLIKIIGYTFIIEVFGIILIQFTSGNSIFNGTSESWMFSIFHSVILCLSILTKINEMSTLRAIGSNFHWTIKMTMTNYCRAI